MGLQTTNQIFESNAVRSKNPRCVGVGIRSGRDRGRDGHRFGCPLLLLLLLVVVVVVVVLVAVVVVLVLVIVVVARIESTAKSRFWVGQQSTNDHQSPLTKLVMNREAWVSMGISDPSTADPESSQTLGK